MGIDLTKLCEDELIELNQRIVERLQLIRSAKSLTQLDCGYRVATAS